MARIGQFFLGSRGLHEEKNVCSILKTHWAIPQGRAVVVLEAAREERVTPRGSPHPSAHQRLLVPAKVVCFESINSRSARRDAATLHSESGVRRDRHGVIHGKFLLVVDFLVLLLVLGAVAPSVALLSAPGPVTCDLEQFLDGRTSNLSSWWLSERCVCW